MIGSDVEDGLRRIRDVATRHTALRLVVLFGSRARGEATERSDWDVGYVADGPVDADALLAELVLALGTDRVDLVDLARASGLVRFRAARDGVPVLAASEGGWEAFCLEAASFWCDVEPVLRAAYADVLAELER